MAGLREKTVFADRRFTVTVIETLELRSSSTSGRRFTAGNLKPIAVVVKEPDRTYTFDIDPGNPESR